MNKQLVGNLFFAVTIIGLLSFIITHIGKELSNKEVKRVKENPYSKEFQISPISKHGDVSILKDLKTGREYIFGLRMGIIDATPINHSLRNTTALL